MRVTRRPLRSLSCFLLALLAPPYPLSAAVLRVRAGSPAENPDGATWAKSYPSIASALQAAMDGDELWVAQGIYTGGFQAQQPHIYVYGGFAGNEDALSQRSPPMNPAVLDLGGQDAAFSPSYAAADPRGAVRLDGFTVLQGNVRVTGELGTQATIADNSITAGSITVTGDVFLAATGNTLRNGSITTMGGECQGASIVGNMIKDGAIVSYRLVAESLDIRGNTILRPTGAAGISVDTLDIGGASIVNNVVTGGWPSSGAAGISCKLPSDYTAHIAGNSIGGTDGGIYCTACAVTVVGNTLRENGGGVRGGGIVCLRPDSGGYRELEIRGNDVSGNSGDNAGIAVPMLGDGYTRVSVIDNLVATDGAGTAIDILGAEAAIANNVVAGGDVRVEHLGGPSVQTVIGNRLTGGHVSVFANTANISVQNNILVGSAAAMGAPGIAVVGDSMATVSGNQVTGYWAVAGGGIFMSVAGSGIIQQNRLVRNRAQNGGAVYATDQVRLASGNWIQDNVADENGGGIYWNVPFAAVTGNTLTGNHAGGSGGALFASNRQNSIANNLMAGNSAGGVAGGIRLAGEGNRVYSNTIAASSGAGIGIGADAILADNVVAFNDIGVTVDSGSVVHSHNDVFGNAHGDYVGVADPSGSGGNIRVDPRFADTTAGDFHLVTTSPCIDAGDNAFADAGTLDLDGEARVYGPAVDIGAYEAGPRPWRLEFSRQPGGGVKGRPFRWAPTVVARDADLGVIRRFHDPITLGIRAGSGAPGARLIGAARRLPVSGMVTFDDAAIDSSAPDYILTATNGTLSAESEPFCVPLIADIPIVQTDRPITLDGSITATEWTGAPLLRLGLPEQIVWGHGTWLGAPDYSAGVRLKWSNAGLYFAIEARDDVAAFPAIPSEWWLFDRDGMELFLGLGEPLNPNRRTFSEPGDYQIVVSAEFVGGAPRAEWYSPQRSAVIHGFPDEVVWAPRLYPGYTVEGLLRWQQLGIGAPVLGQVIAFNAMGKDNDQAYHTEDTAFSLSGLAMSSSDPSRWTTAILMPPPPVYGDADGDGLLSIRDVAAMLRISGGLAVRTAPMPTLDVAPPGGDGFVDSLDALGVLRALVGLDPWLP